MPMTAEERKSTKAAQVNSIERAESLCITPALIWRYVVREPVARGIIDAWEPRLCWQDRIRYVEVLDV